MSQRDREILEKVELSISTAAAVLGVKPQAVSQGLLRDADYLKGARLQKLVDHVLVQNPSALDTLNRFLGKEEPSFESPKTTPSRIEKLRMKGTVEKDKMSTLWIFSSSPLELRDRKKLKDAEEEFYSNSDFSIVYFVPRRVSQKLHGLLLNVLTRLLSNQDPNNFRGIAHVEVVECPAVDLVPHFAIANPITTADGDMSRGWVLVGDGDEEAPLPNPQVENILQVLLAKGIGTDPDNTVSTSNILPQKSDDEWAGLEFRSIFSSKELIKQFLKKKTSRLLIEKLHTTSICPLSVTNSSIFRGDAMKTLRWPLTFRKQPSVWRELINKKPKAELHLHLEGSINFNTVIELARKNNVKLRFSTVEKLKKRCVFQKFDDFGDFYVEIIKALQRPEDFTRIVIELGERLRRDGTVYAEVTWTPQLHVTHQFPFRTWIEAANEGRRHVEEKLGVTMRWVLDICRDREATQKRVVEWASSAVTKNGGVVALGLGGTETKYPAYRFINAFKEARKNGLRAVPHAGEHAGKYAGPSSVWTAIEALGANRIGHGNRAVEEEELLRHLAQKQIPLEICPTSNIKFGLYKDLRDHPLQKLLDAGCFVTINTDDPEIFDTSLTDELTKIAEILKLSEKQIDKLIDNAFSAAFDKEAAEAARKRAGAVVDLSDQESDRKAEEERVAA